MLCIQIKKVSQLVKFKSRAHKTHTMTASEVIILLIRLHEKVVLKFVSLSCFEQVWKMIRELLYRAQLAWQGARATCCIGLKNNVRNTLRHGVSSGKKKSSHKGCRDWEDCFLLTVS